MYAKLQFSANWTSANMMADIILALTGTTNLASFSANLNQANSFINTSSRTAGWTVHDAAAGAGAQVLTAPCVSGNNKYIKISQSAGIVYIQAHETWNATTHTGTNPTITLTSFNPGTYTLTNSVAIHISASNRHIAASGFDVSITTPANSVTGVFEYVRTGIYDTPANAFPNFVQTPASGISHTALTGATDSSNGFTMTRMLNCASLNPNNLTGSSAICGSASPFGTNAYNILATVPQNFLGCLGNSAVPAQTFDASLVKSHQLIPWGVIAPNYFNVLGDVSSLADIYYTTTAFGSFGDELTIGGNTYVIWTLVNTARMAVRKG